jgi:transforming growth factor-beta-induced protein
MLNAKRKLYFVLGVLLLSFAISAWGAQPAAATAAIQEESEQSVWDVITANEELGEFATLTEAAVLADNLDGDGPFTVFAPTNSVLDDLQSIFADSETTPTDALLYHIVNGNYNGAAVANRSTLMTLMGEPISIDVKNGQIVLNDTVIVTTTDIVAENGVVHVINGVLLPPENALSTSDKGSPDATLLQVLEEDGRFTTFLTLAEQAGFTDEFSAVNNTYTIFAPTDTAFENMSEEQMDEYTKNTAAIKAILSYHLVGDELGINQIATDDYIPTLEGRPLFVTYNEDDLVVRLNGQPLTDFNIVAKNGVIHAVDAVLAP